MNYTPTPLQGTFYRGYIKINKLQVRLLLNSGQVFKGFIVGNRVTSAHAFSGNKLAIRIQAHSWQEFKFQIDLWTKREANPTDGFIPAIYLKQPKQIAILAK